MASSTRFALWVRLVTNNLTQVTNGDVIWRLSRVVVSHASSLPVLNRVYGEMSGLGWCHLGRVTSCCLSPCQDPTGHQLRQDQRPPTLGLSLLPDSSNLADPGREHLPQQFPSNNQL